MADAIYQFCVVTVRVVMVVMVTDSMKSGKSDILCLYLRVFLSYRQYSVTNKVFSEVFLQSYHKVFSHHSVRSHALYLFLRLSRKFQYFSYSVKGENAILIIRATITLTCIDRLFYIFYVNIFLFV